MERTQKTTTLTTTSTGAEDIQNKSITLTMVGRTHKITEKSDDMFICCACVCVIDTPPDPGGDE